MFHDPHMMEIGTQLIKLPLLPWKSGFLCASREARTRNADPGRGKPDTPSGRCAACHPDQPPVPPAGPQLQVAPLPFEAASGARLPSMVDRAICSTRP